MHRSVTVTWLVTVCLAGTAAGQSVVRGSVRADSTARGIAGATVSVDGLLSRSAATDVDGRFTLTDLPAGRITLTIRAVGYRPLQAPAAVSGVDTLEVDVLLAPLAQTLAPLAVTGRPAPASGRLLDFERRRRAGFGHFFTRSDLAAMDTERLSNLIRLVAGVQLVMLPHRCNSGLAAASGRLSDPVLPQSMWCGDQQPRSACYLDIYVDGSHRWRYGDGPPPDIDQFAVREFQAIEIYRGRSELPIEMTRGEPACGAIVLWSRTGDP